VIPLLWGRVSCIAAPELGTSEPPGHHYNYFASRQPPAGWYAPPVLNNGQHTSSENRDAKTGSRVKNEH